METEKDYDLNKLKEDVLSGEITDSEYSITNGGLFKGMCVISGKNDAFASTFTWGNFMWIAPHTRLSGKNDAFDKKILFLESNWLRYREFS